MKAYSIHPETAEYLGEVDCQPSPLEPGQFLVPGGATTTEPPTAGEHQVPVWDGAVWTLKADYRGITYWHKTTRVQYTLQELDCYPDADWTDQDPAEVDLAYTKWDGDAGKWVYDSDAKAAADALASAREALAVLTSTDWYASRRAELGTEIPAEILEQRAAARAAIDAAETASPGTKAKLR